MRLGEWARRRAARESSGTAIDDFLAGASTTDVVAKRGLPLAAAEGIRSFYELIDRGPRVCSGTSCRFAPGSNALCERLATLVGGEMAQVRCLGHCYAAPAFMSGKRVFAHGVEIAPEAWIESWGEGAELHEDVVAIPRRSLAPTPVILRNLVHAEPAQHAAWDVRGRLHEYQLPQGSEILDAIERTRLRGRGGAAFPTAAKWRAARDTAARERCVVANGDEGDPGSYVDRLLLEEDPHAVLAGVVACARTIGAGRAYIYIRAEYPRAREVVERAVRSAHSAGCLEGIDVQVTSGAGSYVCGEETALLNSMEGLRGAPRIKPPYPAESGLWGMPTVVQNIETLAAVPWIARTGRPAGTKVVCVAGAVARPCAVEMELGTTLRRVFVEGAGGPASDRGWKMALVGGPLGRVLPEHLFDAPLDYDALPGFGHGGVVVFDHSVTVRALAEHLFEFGRAESCGSCAPCRIGTARLADLRDRASLERLLETLELGSLCGFGPGVARPIRDLLQHFGEEVFP